MPPLSFLSPRGMGSNSFTEEVARWELDGVNGGTTLQSITSSGLYIHVLTNGNGTTTIQRIPLPRSMQEKKEEEEQEIAYIETGLNLGSVPSTLHVGSSNNLFMASLNSGTFHILPAKINDQFDESGTLRMSLTHCNLSKEELEQLRHFVEKGKGWSMAALAERYREGIGVDQSWEQAAHFYKMGVEHGDVSSMVVLGLIYMTGQGVEQDIEKAKELWMKAAKLGDITAILFLKKLDKQEGKVTPSFIPTPTFCSYCGKAHTPPTTKLGACRGCRSVFYCCKEHQILDWKLKQNGHKEKCGQLKELNKQ